MNVANKNERTDPCRLVALESVYLGTGSLSRHSISRIPILYDYQLFRHRCVQEYLGYSFL